MPLVSQSKFFDATRNGVMGPKLDVDEVSGSLAIMEAMEGLPIAYCAYALATAWLETANSLQPIKEFGGPNYFHRMYDPNGQRPKVAKALGNVHVGDGAKYCGRGYVQLTGRTNYEKAAAKTGADLVNNPDLAMRQDIAAKVMRWGMTAGAFTGKSFASYLPAGRPATKVEFVWSRRIINGQDRANDIAKYAMQFQDALVAGGWTT
jgi:putative chitinase